MANQNLVTTFQRFEFFSRSSGTIEDVATESDSREKSCKHVWQSSTEGPHELIAFEGYQHWVTNRLSIMLREFYQTQIAQLRTLSGLSLDDVPEDVRIKAIDRLVPSVNDGLSLLNALLELKDLRRLFSIKTGNLSRYLEAFFLTPAGGGDNRPFKEYTGPRLTKHGIRRFGVRDNRGKPRPNETIREKLVKIAKATYNQRKFAADDFLNWNFGWKPFISDLSGIYRALMNFDTRLKYIEANAGKVLRRHVSIPLDTSDLPLSFELSTSFVPFFGGGTDGTNGFQQTAGHCRYVYQPRYHATLVYSYTLPKVKEWRRKLRGYLDAFGVRLDPYIIWEAIPFSFVVDWFLNVGGFLRSFTPRDLGMEVSVMDYSESLKYHTLAETRSSIWFTSEATGKVTTGDIPIDMSEYSYYERRRDIPSFHSIAAGLPGNLQVALGAALVLSKSGNRKHRTRRR